MLQNAKKTPNQPSPHLCMLLLMLVKYPHSLPWESQKTDDLNSLHLASTEEKLAQKNHSSLRGTMNLCEQ